MKPTTLRRFFFIAIFLATTLAESVSAQDRVKTANGMVEGSSEKSSGIRTFKGVPCASPPVGDLRWQPPQPVNGDCGEEDGAKQQVIQKYQPMDR